MLEHAPISARAAGAAARRPSAAHPSTQPQAQAMSPAAAPPAGDGRNAALWRRAQEVIPGGVNSPVRAFGSVGGTPIFIASAAGAHVTSVDGATYLDFIGSWGPLIAGHAHPDILAAVAEAAGSGTSFGATTEREVELAEEVCRLVPSVDRVRFVSSGTEATMSAVRLARGATGRHKLVKFGGCYHGHADAFLSGAGSGLATLGIPASAGVPPAAVADVITLPFNDLQRASEVMAELGDEVAAVLLEPVPCNMGLVEPEAGFLPGLRALCDAHGSVLIFDEVITGFRLQADGAQGRLQVRPDLTCFGKIIGGGLPVGAYGGRRELMAHVSPQGPVYQAGTLSGNPLAMAAGRATLRQIGSEGFFARLEQLGRHLDDGMGQIVARHAGRLRFDRVGSIFYMWFGDSSAGRPKNFADISRGDAAAYGRLFHRLLARRVMLAPSAFEVGFLSAAHRPADIDTLVAAVGEALDEETWP